ncbi:glycoprotein hormone beta-5-like [Asterias rubens]|uniref:glycoprotein hormone beta-5-like n=1 Tax=Asterias rubens TaxID=7604 RepID=UPI001454F284|nr:glycoprotein hormone beta-5-like [Asterias rubens]
MFFKCQARHRWTATFLPLFALALLIGTIVEGARYQDKSMPFLDVSCRVREYTKYEAKLPGCMDEVVPARGCYGRCQSFEVPVLLPPHKASSHKMCLVEEIELLSVELSDCLPGVNRTFVYQSAVRCRCKKCIESNTFCARN